LKHAESKKRETGSAPPFYKMAAADISKINEILLFDHLSTDFDEIWFTDQEEHAESKKRITGSVSPFFKMAAADNSKISELLFFGHSSPNF
jgi:hypothetical protein